MAMDAWGFLGQLTQTDLGGCPGNTLLAELENWDSLKAVRLVLRLEEVIGRPLSESDIERLKSLADVQEILRSDV